MDLSDHVLELQWHQGLQIDMDHPTMDIHFWQLSFAYLNQQDQILEEIEYLQLQKEIN